eukprot:SAG22_NODE_1829_length_3484_cov_2.530576_4_plen_208_part_00
MAALFQAANAGQRPLAVVAASVFFAPIRIRCFFMMAMIASQRFSTSANRADSRADTSALASALFAPPHDPPPAAEAAAAAAPPASAMMEVRAVFSARSSAEELPSHISRSSESELMLPRCRSWLAESPGNHAAADVPAKRGEPVSCVHALAGGRAGGQEEACWRRGCGPAAAGRSLDSSSTATWTEEPFVLGNWETAMLGNSPASDS